MKVQPDKPLPKILVVEDNVMLQALYKANLSKTAEVIPAHTLDEAEMLFNEHSDSLAAIVFDGEVPDSERLTVPLIKSIVASGYKGPMIAASSRPEFCVAMVAAGCQYSIRNMKNEVYGIIGVILKNGEDDASEPTPQASRKSGPKPSGP